MKNRSIWMRNFSVNAIAAVILSLTSTAIHAETWIARCNNLQFNFDRNAKSYILYFKTSAGIFQMGTGKIIFDNGSAIRGPLTGNPIGTSGEPLTEIGLNPSRNLVYVLYHNLTDHTTKSGDFCTTTISRVN